GNVRGSQPVIHKEGSEREYNRQSSKLHRNHKSSKANVFDALSASRAIPMRIFLRFVDKYVKVVPLIGTGVRIIRFVFATVFVSNSIGGNHGGNNAGGG
ncbi:MAG: hypothetical protein ABSG34_12070, partial [Candidatus Sulfotelmatobacter sp.]